MAIYHCSVKIGSRGKGQSAVAAAAYRSGEKLTDQETGLISDYTRKGGVVFSEISLCENAPAEYADRATLWNAVHQIEKAKDARLWREIEVALPKEFSREDQIATVRDFVKQLTEKGMCADWSLHDKGDGNPHAHIMLTVRSIEPSGKWAPKSRKVYDLDENGERIFQKVDKSGRKQYKCHKEDYNDWNATERVEEWRAAWAECCNTRLAEHDRIDHRSYARQGIAKMPTVHEGYAARKRVADGLPSDRVQINAEIRQENVLIQQIKEFGGKIQRLINGNPKELFFKVNRWEIPYIQREMKKDDLVVRFEERNTGLYGFFSEADEDAVKGARHRFVDKVLYLNKNMKSERVGSGFEIQDTHKQFAISFGQEIGRAEFVEQMRYSFGYDENTAHIAAAKFTQETLLPKERKKFIDQNEVGSVRHLIALRNNYIRQMMISAWLRINPVLRSAQEDLKQATILKEKFEMRVKEYFKSLDLARSHQKQVPDMQPAKAGEQLDHAAVALQKHLGFMIIPFLAGDRNIRSHIELIRRSVQHNMERKQKAADAEIARNQKIDVLTAEKITEDSVQDALRAYEQACAAIPNDLRQDAREAVTAFGDSPRPVGEYDSEIMQFYEKSMDRVHKAAVKTMPIPSDFDRQEQVDKNDNGFYRGRTM